ncbi:YHS domain-containing protein, partial [bacterium]|nr:YHS domain-containing protein [bacterium]
MSHPTERATAATTVKDPVCGMDVDPTVSTHRSEHDGATFHFCSARCKATFDADPASYSSSGPDALADHDGAHEHHGHGPSADGAASTPAPGEVAEWTCPMHPEIRRPGPGSCPICGMALEPVMVTADSGPSPELAD